MNEHTFWARTPDLQLQYMPSCMARWINACRPHAGNQMANLEFKLHALHFIKLLRQQEVSFECKICSRLPVGFDLVLNQRRAQFR